MYTAGYSRRILTEQEFSRQICENTQMSNFIKIRPVAAELFHDDGRDKANRPFTQYFQRT
jgi:hypothetical protein